MGHLVSVWISEEALDPPDLAIDGMDTVTVPQLNLTFRNNVLGDHTPAYRLGTDVDEFAGAHGCIALVTLVYQGVAEEATAAAAGAFHHVAFLGGVKLVELRARAAQPDFAGRSVDQVYRNKPPGVLPVPRLDDKVSDRISGWVDDQAAHFAARAIRAACPGPDRELQLLCHCCPSFPVMVRIRPVLLDGADVMDRIFPDGKPDA
jgi:hypothetical protein